MAYRFELDETLPEAVRRIGCEQLDIAIAQLGRNAERDDSVHQTRKCLKRTRALLRLVRPALVEETFHRENKSLRDIARGLARARDSQAMLEAVARIEARPGATGVAAALRGALEARPGEMRARLDDSDREAIVRALHETRRRLGQMAVREGWRGLAEGLRQSYRRGRKAFARARRGGTDEDFHEWRKGAQLHWRQMLLLAPLWPEEFEARAATAKELSQLLGDDHDLHILTEFLKQEGPQLGLGCGMETLMGVCQAEQRELRARAEPLGRRLFAEKARPFRNRVMAYRRAAQAVRPVEVAAAGEGPPASAIGASPVSAPISTARP